MSEKTFRSVFLAGLAIVLVLLAVFEIVRGPAQTTSYPPATPVAPTSTVTQLPACDGTSIGQVRIVTDALLPTFLATIAGGGAIRAMVFCNGSSWVAG